MTYCKWVIALLILIVTCNAANSQEVIYSRYEDFDYRTDVYHVVGMSGGYLYTYLHDDESAKLEAYDDSMSKKATIILDFFPPRIYQTQFIAYPDKIMVLYQALESNKVVQYMAMLNSNGMLRGKPLQIGSTRTGIFGATRTYYSMAISDNKKQILIYSAVNKGSNIEFDGTWLDDNGTVLKKSKAKFKTENNTEHGDVNIANDGTVYLAAYTPIGSQNYADQYWLLTLKPGLTEFTSVEMDLGERYATSGYTKIDNVNNKVYFGGFYSDKKNGNFDGIIFSAYDLNSNNFTSTRFIPFDPELIAATGSRSRAQAFDNYLVRQLIVKNDGGFVLISELQYINVRSTFTPGFGYYSFYTPYMNTTVREYHYNDIMALSYNADGSREWHSFIRKQQYSQEDEGVFSSYALLNSGGSLAFLYNDFDPRHSRIQLSTLSPTGSSETHSLVTETMDYPDWLPRFAKQVAGRVLVVPCFRKKTICFARVAF